MSPFRLKQLLPRMPPGLLPDEQTTHHYAHLYLQLRKKSVAIPTNDLWIAALVVQHNLVLCSSDVHFQHFPQVPRC